MSRKRSPNLVKYMLFVSLWLCCAAIRVSGGQANAFDHSHALFATVLEKYVSDGAVDYKGLKADVDGLKSYLDGLAAVPEATFNDWSRPDQLAFLLNVYNAATLQLVIEHYPVTSIKDIGSSFKSPWRLPWVRLFGRTITLDTLEHRIIRPRFHDPAVHFALVCAAKGCPPLRSEPFVGSRLKEQFTDQARSFLAQSGKNRVDPPRHTVYLSPIFKWYREDFRYHHSGRISRNPRWL